MSQFRTKLKTGAFFLAVLMSIEVAFGAGGRAAAPMVTQDPNATATQVMALTPAQIQAQEQAAALEAAKKKEEERRKMLLIIGGAAAAAMALVAFLPKSGSGGGGDTATTSTITSNGPTSPPYVETARTSAETPTIIRANAPADTTTVTPVERATPAETRAEPARTVTETRPAPAVAREETRREEPVASPQPVVEVKPKPTSEVVRRDPPREEPARREPKTCIRHPRETDEAPGVAKVIQTFGGWEKLIGTWKLGGTAGAFASVDIFLQVRPEGLASMAQGSMAGEHAGKWGNVEACATGKPDVLIFRALSRDGTTKSFIVKKGPNGSMEVAQGDDLNTNSFYTFNYVPGSGTGTGVLATRTVASTTGAAR